MILKIIQQIIQMFDKIQMILMMKTSISNNRMSRLKKSNFCKEFFDELEELRNHYLNSHHIDTCNSVFKEYWERLQADQNFISEKCCIFEKRFLNATARGKYLLLRHFHQSTSSSNQDLFKKQIGIEFLEFSIVHRVKKFVILCIDVSSFGKSKTKLINL